MSPNSLIVNALMVVVLTLPRELKAILNAVVTSSLGASPTPI
jgi:hypothetical protein